MITIFTNIEQFRTMELGTKLYRPNIDSIDNFYYGGINPKAPTHIMLISGSNVTNIICVNTKFMSLRPLYTSYDQAKVALFKNALANVSTVTEVYCTEFLDD